MALAIDVIHQCGPSNKMRCRLQPKKTLGNAVLFVFITAKGILPAVHY